VEVSAMADTPQANPAVLSFMESRKRLIARLIETRDQVDAWLNDHLEGDPSIRDLALFEGLLSERRDLLSRS
jgi:hypothetical protein